VTALQRLGVRSRLRAAWRRAGETRHWLTLRRRLEAGRPDEYREYLETQLRRSLSKRANDPGIGARVLIDAVAQSAGERRSSILCVGCRNPVELDEFRARGFENVVGIDLFSQRDDILVMDMHELTFPDDSFDVVYASHALEHAYDVGAVVGQIARVGREGALVAVEVPVRHRGSTADRVEFSGLDELRQTLGAHLGEELLAEEQEARSPTNEQGSDVARIVFRLRKPPESSAAAPYPPAP
jgi:SAM-dependent methyltransferase